MLLQQAYDLSARDLNFDKLQATSSQVIDLQNWKFVSSSTDDLGGGLLPYSTPPPDAPSSKGRKALAEEHERSRLYDLSGDAVSGAMSSAGAKKI